MAFLTDQTLASGVTLQDLIHIVITGDTSQGNPAGSSYKATIEQVLSGFTGTTLYEVGAGTDSTQRVGTSNDSSGNYSVVSGGFNNTVFGNTSGIVSGTNNLSNGSGSIIGGGRGNTISNDYTSVLGGCGNTIDQITASGFVFGNTIGGGSLNTIMGFSTTSDAHGNLIGGGNCNTIQPILNGGQVINGGFCNMNLSDFSVLSGGFNNTNLGINSFIGGGSFNTTDGTRSVITGGGGSCPALGNKTLCNYNFIGGGIQNVVNGTFSSIVGGGSISLANGNTINSCYSTIVGGCRNLISHDFSTVIGSNITTQSACTVHVNNLLIKDTPPQDQTATNYLVRDTTSGMVKYKTIPGPTVYGLFTQTSNSTPVSGTILESSIVGTGLGTLSVPANGFSIGDSFKLIMGGHITFKNNDTLRVRVKANNVVLGDTGTITIQNLTNRHWILQVDFTIRSLGGPGIASVVSVGKLTYVKNASTNYEGTDFSTVENSLFNTTVLNTLDVTVQYNSTSLINNMYSELMTLTKTY